MRGGIVPSLFYNAKKGCRIATISPSGERIWECVSLEKPKVRGVTFEVFSIDEKRGE